MASPFFTRPNFEDRQVVQYSGRTITLSGDTNINQTGNIRIQKGAFPGLVATSLDSDGTVGWGPISGISWSISACTSPLYVNNLVSCPSSGGTIQIDAGNLALNSELNFLISLSAGTNTDEVLVIDSNGYVKTIPNLMGIGNMWYVPYGYTLTVPDNYQSFVYGDLYVLGTIDLQTNAQLVVLNGNIILSGGSIIGSGTTYLVTLGGNGCCFTGGTGSCITDLYVSNIHSCSPLNINPLDEGNVYFGSTSMFSVDVTNNRIGLNQPNPRWTFDFYSYDKRSKFFYYDNIGSISPAFADVQEVVLSGTSDLNVIISTAVDGNVSTVMGVRGSNNTGVFGNNVGKVGDGYLSTSAYANGLNIMNFPSVLSNREDYIRFYAGNYATATSDVHIQGSGFTRGYVGIGNEDPQAKLHVSGNTIINSNYAMLSNNLTTIPTLSNFKGFLNIMDSNKNSGYLSSNVNPSGATAVLFSNDSSAAAAIFLAGSQFSRNGISVTTPKFYQDKLVLKGDAFTKGMVINPNGSNPSAVLWFEIDSASNMILKGDGVAGSGNGFLGLRLNPDGTEMPTSNLQIGGTGTTGTVQVNQDVLNVNAKNTYGKFRPNYYTVIDSGTSPISPGVYGINIPTGWVIEQVQLYTKTPDSVLVIGSLAKITTVGGVWFPNIGRPFGFSSGHFANMVGFNGTDYIDPVYFPSGDTLLVNFIDPFGVSTDVTDGEYKVLITYWDGTEIL